MTTNNETKVTVNGVSFSESDIQALKSGESLDGSLSTGIRPADVYVPSSSAPISGYAKSIKPVIRNEAGEALEQALVTAPRMDKNNSNHESEMQRIALEQASIEKERAELRSFMEPAKLRSEIEYLQRTVRRLEKSLKAIQKRDS